MRRPTDIAAATLSPIELQPIALQPIGAPARARVPVTAAQVGAADIAVNGPPARSGGLSGAGVKVGIISDSFDLSGGAAADERAGLLPAGGVTVLEEGGPGGNDEGRAMAELIHATAPGAQLYFSTGASSEDDFAASVAALRAAGCQIIVDDLTYADEPMFQVAGPIDAAIQAAVSAGTDYFTAVGNDGDAYYQAGFAPRLVSIAGLGTVRAQTFSGGAATQSVTIAGGTAVTLSLQWDAPYGADNADSITVKVISGTTVIATSTQAGNAPVTMVDFPALPHDRSYTIAILSNAGTPVPATFKYVLEGGGTIDDPAAGQGSGAALGHALVPGVNAVGAVDVADTPAEGGTPAPEDFSSAGGSQLLFAPNGSRLVAAQAVGAPAFLAPDGAATSVFDPFDGTSAAAPVVAAVAALMLQAHASLSTADISTLLEDSAIPVASPDDAAGAGLIQANLAANYASTGVIAGSMQTVIRGTAAACTIQGGAGSRWLVAGSGNTLIQSQGTDSVMTGAGADTVDLWGAAAAVYAGTGATWVRNLGGQDTVVGGTGALTVSGGAGGGVIFGSTAGGNQLVAGLRPTTILSEGTGDFVAGSGDGDLLYASDAGGDTVVGGGGVEILVGGTRGGGGADVFIAGNGDPLVAPEASTAVVTFGTGDVTVLVGSGAELLQAVNGQAGGFEAVYGFDATKDLLLLSGFGGEQAAAEASIANQYDIGGNSWLKLPDGTVIAFVGLTRFASGSAAYG